MSLYDINEKTQIDEYGVCHKDFSLRDELEYNIMRQKEKEQQMKQQSQPQSQVQNVKTQQSQNDNNVEDFMNKLSSLYQEYFGERNYQNRYCTILFLIIKFHQTLNLLQLLIMLYQKFR